MTGCIYGRLQLCSGRWFIAPYAHAHNALELFVFHPLEKMSCSTNTFQLGIESNR